MDRLRRARAPLAIFALTAVVYVVVLGDRRMRPSADNHFVHLAESLLAGQLSLVDGRPPGTNDWACYDRETHGPCPINRYEFPASEADRYKWYVSFPPLPAVVILPVVAVMGRGTPDALFWAILAGLGPALLYVLLRRLREEHEAATGRMRKPREDVALSLLFAFGTVWFFTAVQGTVWFAAHVVCVPLLVLYVLFSLGAKRPVLAGAMLALAFVTRPTTALLVVLFVVELLAAARRDGAPAIDADAGMWKRLATWLRGVDWARTVKPAALFAAPILAVGAVAMWMNDVRFEDPFEFGHAYLQIRWRPRIERWGLFNFHYLGKNLAVFFAALPWLTATEPYLRISRHGLALWVTTPNLLAALWPKRVTATMVGLFAATALVALLNLCYQNSGWVQFGYRFALDYLPVLFALLALSGRRFGPGFWALALLAVAINTFGAITFDRAWIFYDDDPTQNVIFHPD